MRQRALFTGRAVSSFELDLNLNLIGSVEVLHHAPRFLYWGLVSLVTAALLLGAPLAPDTDARSGSGGGEHLTTSDGGGGAAAGVSRAGRSGVESGAFEVRTSVLSPGALEKRLRHEVRCLVDAEKRRAAAAAWHRCRSSRRSRGGR